MPDIAMLDTLVDLDPIDFDNYAEAGEGGGLQKYAPPPEGVYFAKVPQISDANFGATGQNYLKCNIDPLVILSAADGSPTGKDYAIRFASVSAKKYSNREGSQALDFLHACGIAARPTTNKELIAALKQASGRTVKLSLVWEAYNKDSQTSTKGYDNFPDDPQKEGQKLPFVPDPDDADKRWWANGKVRSFLSQLKS